MSSEFTVFLSNRLEVLYQHLKFSLFNSNLPPLMRRLVVVYGPAMKSWLMLKMAQDPDLHIAMGVEFISLNQAFDALLNLTSLENKNYIPTSLELNLAIEKELLSIIYCYDSLSEEVQNDWKPLLHYLKLDLTRGEKPVSLTKKMERRLLGLSEHLTQLFRDYGRYAGTMVMQWERSPKGWQQRLWQKIFGQETGWTYPYRALQTCHAPAIPFSLQFFSISFLTASEFTYLHRLSSYIPINYYLLSPCAVFWSDIRSDRENAYLRSFWQKKLGQSSPYIEQLEEMLRDRNPLLANFGRLGREMSTQIEESLAQTIAHYVLPEKCEVLEEELFANDDLYLEESTTPLSLLNALQTDLLLMRNPQDGHPFDLNEDNGSIQLHSTPNIRREIQVLYHNLLGLMAKNPSLCPKDIIVMAPQIGDYVPYIQSQFGGEESQLDFQILDLGMQIQCEVTQGFFQLIKLSESRWSSKELLQLFEFRSFQKRHQLSPSDYLTIKTWIEQAGILWGDDWLHRNELLLRSHCAQGMADETTSGTWEFGLSRLLLGLTTIVQTNHFMSEEDELPCSIVDFSQTELMGKWIRLLHSLKDDLTPFQDRTQMTMEDWANYLTCLLENYFHYDSGQSSSIEDYEDLKKQITLLSSSARFFKETLYPFVFVKSHLLTLVQQRGLTYRENHLQSVRFCSLMPLRSIPAKVIALVGMHEGQFPRVSLRSSLNLMTEIKENDYCPQSTDYDRYLFLEAIHSAQETLLISYQGHHHKDSKELQPALVVEELFSYLSKYYTIQGDKISQRCIFKHPFDAFNVNYFIKGSTFFNFSHADFLTAKALQNKDKKNPHRFIENFFYQDHPQPDIIPSKSMIDLKELTAAARNPIKFHLNKKFEIYLQNEEDRKVKKEEELFLSQLDKYRLKELSLRASADSILNHAEKEGKFPFGLFKTIAMNEMKEEFHEIQGRLEKHGIRSNQIFQIEFCASCRYPYQIDMQRWLFPPLTLLYEDGYQISITGKLSHVTENGLLILSKGSFGDTWKIWPQYLMLCYAATLQPGLIKPNLILAYASKAFLPFFEDPIPHLKQFVNYYALCQHQFSPLMPDWIPLILKEDVAGLQDKIQKLYSDYKQNYGQQNQDLRWIFNKQFLPDSETIINEWKEQARLLAVDMMREWHSSKSVAVGVEG